MIDFNSLKVARNTISELMGTYKEIDPVRYAMYLQVTDDLEDMIEQVEEAVHA